MKLEDYDNSMIEKEKEVLMKPKLSQIYETFVTKYKVQIYDGRVGLIKLELYLRDWPAKLESFLLTFNFFVLFYSFTEECLFPKLQFAVKLYQKVDKKSMNGSRR